jgi:acyl dehydratase
MPLDYDRLMSLAVRDRRFRYSDRDTMLYALSVGMGRDPMDAAERAFVYEGGGPQVVPTMAVVLASTGLIREIGADFARILHGEQRLTLHRPLPPAAEIVASSRVAGAFDKGPGRGAVLLLETTARDAADDAPLFTFVMTIIARGDGGFGGPAGSGPAPHPEPARAPDISVPFAIRPDAALLYRLNGDRNPLHADPAMAAKAGFGHPILHGLASYGMACRAVLAGALDYESRRIQTFDARFSAPVYLGDELVTDLWHEDGAIAFRCRVPARDATVLRNGLCTIGPA